MSRRVRAPLGVSAALVGLLSGLAGPVRAQTSTTVPTGDPATTTTLAPTTTATSAPPVPPPTVTTLPSRPKPTAGLVQPDLGGKAPSSSTAPTTAAGAPPTTVAKPSIGADQAQAYVGNLARSGANNTGALLDALRVVETLGFSHDEVLRLGFGHFPVGGYASFRDDFGDPRFTPTFHTHQGNDIFAAFDTPVRAPVDGVVRFGEEPVGGKAAYVTSGDGTYYYMAHLNSFAAGVASGSAVHQGEVVGLVGDTGNAQGGAPHVHFEIHPGGGAAVDPKPTLDRWLAEALAAVPTLFAGYVQEQPPVVQSTGLTRRFDVRELDGRAAPPVEPLLWASSVTPAGSALRLAEAQVARVADGIDWDRRAAQAQAAVDEWQSADDYSRAMLWWLTPPALATLGSSTAG